MPFIPCDIHGTGVRNYGKELDQAEWPRAAAAIDLSRVRPIPVNAPTLLAQSDIYRSVNPALQNSAVNDSNIKVARATTPDGKDPGVTPAERAAKALPAQAVEEKEVRRAEPVRPMDLPTAAPVLTIPAPKPAQF